MTENRHGPISITYAQMQYLADELFPDIELDEESGQRVAVELSVQPPYDVDLSNTRWLQFGELHVTMFPRERGRGGSTEIVTPDGRTRDANETRA